MIELVPIFRVKEAGTILYDLLKERTPEQSISHKRMPSMEEHIKFVFSGPYRAWYLIRNDEDYVGSIYLSHGSEIGIFVFKKYQGKSYARLAIAELMARWKGPFYANINPNNKASIKLFKSLGAKHIQNTYEIES